MREELEKLDNKIKRIKTKKMPTTFLSIINKNFDEVIISRCMAFLLNPEYTTLKIIEQLLNFTQKENDEVDFIQLFNNGITEFDSIDIEEAISSRSRIDIIIRLSTFWIVIENKINSYENNDQSLKYEEDLKYQTDLPIKYICLKPKYNQCSLKNKKFSYVVYDQIVEILKTVTKYELREEENYCYIEDFIKHMEVFLMNENELQISEDVEFYIDNQNIIDNILVNYKKQCELVKNKLDELVKNKFGDDYETYCSKYGYIQIWKKNWNNENCNGIHYEILCDFNHIIGYDVKVKFAMHNEARTKKAYPQIKHQTIKENRYKLDNSKNIEVALNEIVSEMYNIAEEHNMIIDEIFNK